MNSESKLERHGSGADPIAESDVGHLRGTTNQSTSAAAPVPELCQNPIHLVCRELLFEREQLPQVVDTRHIQIELIERLEPGHILRNQQVAGSIPAGGSSLKSRI
jgi:hypothetical protein